MRIPAAFPLRAFRHCLALLIVVTSAAYGDDGEPDPTFANTGLALHEWPANTIQAETTTGAVAADGSIIAAGWISYPSGQQQFATTLLRYRSNGTPDPGFGIGGLATLDLDPAPQIQEIVYAVFPRTDGSLLMLAGIEIPGQMPFRSVLVSVRANGTLDTTFGSGGIRSIDLSVFTESDVFMRTAAMQPDGKIVLAGINLYADSYNVAVGRLLPDGSLDTSFSSDGWRTVGGLSAYDWAPESIAFDDIGRIYVAGRADASAGDRPVIFRMSAAGLPDNSFGQYGDGALVLEDLQGSWTARAIVAAKRIIAGGFVSRRVFVAITASSPNRAEIAAINENGSLSNSFGDAGFVDLTREEGSRITALAMRGDQRLVAAGFIDPNGTGTGTDVYVARMDFAGTLDPSFDGNGVARYPLEPVGTTYDSVATLLLSAQRPVIIGAAFNNNLPRTYSAVMRLKSDAIFADGFNG